MEPMADKPDDIWEGFEDTKNVAASVREIARNVLEIIRNLAVVSLFAFAARTTKNPILFGLTVVGEVFFTCHCFSFVAPYIWHPRPRSPKWRARSYIALIVFMTLGLSAMLIFTISLSIDTLVEIQRKR